MTLREVFSSIANAIRSKTGKTDTIKPVDMATEIESISSGENLFKYYCDNTGDFPRMSDKLTDDVLSKIIDNPDVTANATSLKASFYGCPKLTTFPLMNTSKVTNMNQTFMKCTNVISFPQLDYSLVTDFMSTFFEMQNVEKIKLNNLATGTFYNTFINLYKVKTIDIYQFTGLAYSSAWFTSSCYSLTKLIIRNVNNIPTVGTILYNSYHMTGTVNATYNPEGLKDGRIYVPDEWVEQFKVATNWVKYADVIVPLSTLVEDEE